MADCLNKEAIWTRDKCIEQTILRLREYPEYIHSDPETIQTKIIDMPFNKSIIELAQKQYHLFFENTSSLPSICTYSECVNQVKLMLDNKLPHNYNSKKCYVQNDLNLPFRKCVIKMALFDIYSKQQNSIVAS